MTVLKELCVVTRTYTDKSGSEKKVWKKVGEIHASKEGREYMVLDPLVNLAAIPRKEGDDRVFVSMFEPKPKESRQSPTYTEYATSNADVGEDIPF